MQQKLYDVDGVQQYKYGLYFGYEEKTVGTVPQKHAGTRRWILRGSSG